MKEGGFNLRKWISNSEKLMQWIDHEEGLPIMETSTASEEDKTYTQTVLSLEQTIPPFHARGRFWVLIGTL